MCVGESGRREAGNEWMDEYGGGRSGRLISHRTQAGQSNAQPWRARESGSALGWVARKKRGWGGSPA